MLSFGFRVEALQGLRCGVKRARSQGLGNSGFRARLTRLHVRVSVVTTGQGLFLWLVPGSLLDYWVMLLIQGAPIRVSGNLGEGG